MHILCVTFLNGIELIDLINLWFYLISEIKFLKLNKWTIAVFLSYFHSNLLTALIFLTCSLILQFYFVTMSLYCTVCEVFSNSVVCNDVSLKSGLGHSRSLKMTEFNRSSMSSCLSSTVTMAVSCIFSEMKWDIGGKWSFFILSFSSNPLGKTFENFLHSFTVEAHPWPVRWCK